MPEEPLIQSLWGDPDFPEGYEIDHLLPLYVKDDRGVTWDLNLEVTQLLPDRPDSLMCHVSFTSSDLRRVELSLLKDCWDDLKDPELCQKILDGMVARMKAVNTRLFEAQQEQMVAGMQRKVRNHGPQA